MNETANYNWSTPSPSSHFLHESNSSSSCNNETSTSSGDFWLGVAASVVGSITLNLGINIQKLAFVRHNALPVNNRPQIYRNPLWLLGLLVFLFGNTGDAVGLTFTAQSVITPLGSISLVSNLIFAWLLVGEKLDRATAIGTLFIVIGVILTVSSGNNECTSFTLDQLILLFSQGGFLAFAALHICCLACLLRFLYVKEKEILSVGLHGLNHNTRLLLRLAYPVTGSLFATWTVLLVKSFGELIKQSVRSGESEFQRVEGWLIVLGVLASFPLQYMCIQQGLRHFSAMYIVPVFSSAWTIGSVTIGALFWKEFTNFRQEQYFFFFFGIAIITLGIFLLQQRNVQVIPEETGGNPRAQNESTDGNDAIVTGNIGEAKLACDEPQTSAVGDITQGEQQGASLVIKVIEDKSSDKTNPPLSSGQTVTSRPYQPNQASIRSENLEASNLTSNFASVLPPGPPPRPPPGPPPTSPSLTPPLKSAPKVSEISSVESTRGSEVT